MLPLSCCCSRLRTRRSNNTANCCDHLCSTTTCGCGPCFCSRSTNNCCRCFYSRSTSTLAARGLASAECRQSGSACTVPAAAAAVRAGERGAVSGQGRCVADTAGQVRCCYGRAGALLIQQGRCVGAMAFLLPKAACCNQPCSAQIQQGRRVAVVAPRWEASMVPKWLPVVPGRLLWCLGGFGQFKD